MRHHVLILPQFIQKVLYGHDISHLNLAINTTQTRILMFVSDHPGRSMSEISFLIGLEKSSFTRSVDHLLKLGFLTKQYPEHDRRKVTLALTKKGERAAERIRDDFDAYFESIISHFSEREKREFRETLSSLARFIDRIAKAQDNAEEDR